MVESKGRIKKKTFLFALILFISCLAMHTESYKISSVNYKILGKTRQYALETQVKIDKKKVFTSAEELLKYVEDLKQRLDNTRCFQEIKVDFVVGEGEKDKEGEEKDKEGEAEEVLPVFLFIEVKDSHHLLILPYPKYSSSSGFDIKLKMKDTNFLGSMSDMAGDVHFAIEDKDEGRRTDYTFGLNISFSVPFRISIIDANWANDFSFSYTIGEKTPEWDLQTGLELELPLDRASFKLAFYQSAIRDLDYEDDSVNGKKVHYGDGTYFVEKGEFSIPIILQKIDNWGNVYYTPSVDIVYNWDADGISHKYPDYDAGDGLLGPVMEVGQKISTSRVNWKENFRDGIDAHLTQSISYNFETYTFSPGIEAELKAFKAFKYVGLCANIYGFAYLNTNKGIGDRLRGIRDDQYFSGDTGDDDKKACSTPAAIVFNFDLPIRLFRIYWERAPGLKKYKHADVLDLEFQLSPFIDFALMKNRSTGTVFNPKDGFLSAGLEAIIYPLKWKGIQVRVSFGLDLSRKMPFIKGRFNQEWRKGVSAYELSIGIGLQY